MQATLSLPPSEIVSVVRPKAKPVTYRFRSVFVILCIVFALIRFFTPNQLVTSAAILTLPVLCYLVWREGEPPVLVFACVFQWLQATAAIFYTNHFNVTLEEAFGDLALTVATWLSIAAVVVLAIGVRLGWLGAAPTQQGQIEDEASRLRLGRLAAFYGVTFVVTSVLAKIAFLVSSITQILLAIAALKWAVVFLLCYGVLHQRRGYGYLAFCVGLEFVSGLAGVFSSFKSVFFVLAVASLCSPLALRGRRLAVNIICFVALFTTGVVWTAVKKDYRSFLFESSDDDESLPVERKFGKLADLVESLTWDNVSDGIDAMILRVSYVHFFALSIENVPDNVPYENGKLWGGSIIHVLTPRIFFPDKPSLDDSERTRLYAGVQVSGAEAGTSIGIGYVGESYIDFGPIGMFFPILLLGILYGLMYRWLVINSRYKLIGSSLAVSILIFNAYEIETSNIKIVGGVIGTAIIAFVVYRVFGRTLTNYLVAGSANPHSTT